MFGLQEERPVLTYLNVVVSVVVKVENSVELALHRDMKIIGVLDSLAECLPGVFFHLDVVELPGNSWLHQNNYRKCQTKRIIRALNVTLGII